MTDITRVLQKAQKIKDHFRPRCSPPFQFISDHPVHHKEQNHGDGDAGAVLGESRQDQEQLDGRLEEREALRAPAAADQPQGLPRHPNPIRRICKFKKWAQGDRDRLRSPLLHLLPGRLHCTFSNIPPIRRQNGRSHVMRIKLIHVLPPTLTSHDTPTDCKAGQLQSLGAYDSQVRSVCATEYVSSIFNSPSRCSSS